MDNAPSDALELLKGKNGRLHIEFGVDPAKVTDEWLAKTEIEKMAMGKVHVVDANLPKVIEYGDSLVMPANLGTFLLSMISHGFKSNKIVRIADGRLFVLFEDYRGLAGFHRERFEKYHPRGGCVPVVDGVAAFPELPKLGGAGDMDRFEKFHKKEVAADHFIKTHFK